MAETKISLLCKIGPSSTNYVRAFINDIILNNRRFEHRLMLAPVGSQEIGLSQYSSVDVLLLENSHATLVAKLTWYDKESEAVNSLSVPAGDFILITDPDPAESFTLWQSATENPNCRIFISGD